MNEEAKFRAIAAMDAIPANPKEGKCKYCDDDVDQFGQHIIYGSLGAICVSRPCCSTVEKRIFDMLLEIKSMLPMGTK